MNMCWMLLHVSHCQRSQPSAQQVAVMQSGQHPNLVSVPAHQVVECAVTPVVKAAVCQQYGLTIRADRPLGCCTQAPDTHMTAAATATVAVGSAALLPWLLLS